MYLNKEILKRYNLTDELIDILLTDTLNGQISVKDLILHPDTTDDFRFWCKENLDLDPEDIEAYNTMLNIQKSNHIYQSKNVMNSDIVIKSNNIRTCNSVLNSTDIVNSTNIYNSSSVVDSKEIYFSNYIERATNVYYSNNIEFSNNVSQSNWCSYANNVKNCQSVYEGNSLYKCSEVQYSAFCTSLTKSKRCLFCYNSHDLEYCIFNKPVEKRIYDMVEKTFRTFLEDIKLDFYQEKPSINYGKFDAGVPWNRPDKWYDSLPQRFIDWIKTLPNYNANLLYKITLNKNLIK